MHLYKIVWKNKKSIRETNIGDSLLKTSFKTGSTFKVRNIIISNQCIQNVPNGSKKEMCTKLLKLNFKLSFQKVGCYGLPFILAVKFPSGDLQVQCIYIKMNFSLKINCFRYRDKVFQISIFSTMHLTRIPQTIEFRNTGIRI